MDDVNAKLDDIEYNIQSFIEQFNICLDPKYDSIQKIYEILKVCNEIFDIYITKALRREIYIFNEFYHFVIYKELQLNNEIQNDINYNLSYYKSDYIDLLIKLIKSLRIELDNYKMNEIIPFVIQYTKILSKNSVVVLETGSLLNCELTNTMNEFISRIMVDNCNILVNNFLEYEDEIYNKCFMEQSPIEVKYFYNNKWSSYDLIRNQKLMVLYKIIYEKTYPSYNHL
jgi:hypothetical protein